MICNIIRYDHQIRIRLPSLLVIEIVHSDTMVILNCNSVKDCKDTA